MPKWFVLILVLALGLAQPASVPGQATFHRVTVGELNSFLKLRTQQLVIVGSEIPVGLEKALVGKRLQVITGPSAPRPQWLKGLKAEVKVLPGTGLARGQAGTFMLADGRFFVVKDAKGFVIVDSPQIAAIIEKMVGQMWAMARKP
jgi:hypothetical protein